MALYIPHSIFHLARLLYVRPETFGPYYVCTFVIICHSVLLRMRNVSGKCCWENQNTRFKINTSPPPPPENHAVYKMMWKSMVQPDSSHDNIVRHMRVVCWITKATDTHLEYVALIAFPRQQI